MFKVTSLITFASDAGEAQRSALIARLEEAGAADPACRLGRVGRTYPRSAMGGDIVWHLHFADRAAWQASGVRTVQGQLAGEPAVGHVDACGYEPRRVHIGEPGIASCVYRTLFLSADAGASAATIAQFADEVAAMPHYIPEIRNYALSPVIEAQGARNWTHIWEQEFRSIDDMTGPYMASAYHWGFVDRWFDPEHHDFLVDTRICHSASELATGVMIDYDTAPAGA